MKPTGSTVSTALDQQCLPRTQRCTGSNVCNNPNTGAEELCGEAPQNPGQYSVKLGHANLGFSGSRKRSSGLNLRLEHQFITHIEVSLTNLESRMESRC